jgi:hypothetical protein
MTCATFLKRGGLLIGWIQVLVSAPSVTPANFMKEASYCATVHITQILILIWSDFYMNENQAWQVLIFLIFFFFRFRESWFGTYFGTCKIHSGSDQKTSQP